MKENLEEQLNIQEQPKKANSNLRKAAKTKNDEFYTQLSDIEKEVKNYKKHFKDKIVYCNCDNPEWSNFFKYFTNAFEFLGLKKVITTHYEKGGGKSYKLELSKQSEIIKTELKGDGDFRSEECIEILKEVDIVVTNPPFSLFREYVNLLVENDKKFLIVGSMNAITYKEFFKLIKNNELWLGNNNLKEFVQPNGEIKKFGNINWYTNLEHSKRNEEIILYKSHNGNESDYPIYDNYNAINIDRIKEIPFDFEGVMGVPITFIDKYNPEQFEIIGLGNSRDNFMPNKDYKNTKTHMKNGNIVNSGALNRVLTINQKTKPDNITYYTADGSDFLTAPYARILIKNKNPKMYKYNKLKELK